MDYVNKMCSLWNKVKAAGFNIDEEVAGSLILVDLPNEYKSMILAIREQKLKTVDYVKNLLLQGLSFDSTSNENDNLTASAAQRKWKK